MAANELTHTHHTVLEMFIYYPKCDSLKALVHLTNHICLLRKNIFQCGYCNTDHMIHCRLIDTLHRTMQRKPHRHSAPESCCMQKAKCCFHHFCSLSCCVPQDLLYTLFLFCSLTHYVHILPRTSFCGPWGPGLTHSLISMFWLISSLECPQQTCGANRARKKGKQGKGGQFWVVSRCVITSWFLVSLDAIDNVSTWTRLSISDFS